MSRSAQEIQISHSYYRIFLLKGICGVFLADFSSLSTTVAV